MENSFFVGLGAWNWFIVAAAFAILEVLLPGYMLMWYAVAAVLVGGLALVLDLAWQYQLALYAVIGIALLFAAIRIAGSRTGTSDRPLLNRRGASHIGQTYALSVEARDGRGKLRVEDGEWSVRLEDGGNLPTGARVLVTGIDGNTLIGKAAG
jgi:membrane protein implicated in regulation of membrane protease activity